MKSLLRKSSSNIRLTRAERNNYRNSAITHRPTVAALENAGEWEAAFRHLPTSRSALEKLIAENPKNYDYPDPSAAYGNFDERRICCLLFGFIEKSVKFTTLFKANLRLTFSGIIAIERLITKRGFVLTKTKPLS
jgi:hypothetical protein